MRLEIVPHTRLLRYEPLHIVAFAGPLDDLYTQKTVQTVQIPVCGLFGRLRKGTSGSVDDSASPFLSRKIKYPLLHSEVLGTLCWGATFRSSPVVRTVEGNEAPNNRPNRPKEVRVEENELVELGDSSYFTGRRSGALSVVALVRSGDADDIDLASPAVEIDDDAHPGSNDGGSLGDAAGGVVAGPARIPLASSDVPTTSNATTQAPAVPIARPASLRRRMM